MRGSRAARSPGGLSFFSSFFFPKEAERFLSAPSREFSMEVERINQIQNMTEDLRHRLIELRRYL